ncbi:MAG: sulfur modification protein DndB [Thermoanaerobaculia bacterium]|nr:sulfur modification protein DndB [Thermoanaerobaculia bacterium]
MDEQEQHGWKVEKRLALKVRLRRLKNADERLENRFWYLLYRLGYAELNQSRDFQITIERHGAKAHLKQIDVFAKDDETVIVAECKASGSPRKRSLQKDIEEFGALKGSLAASIKKHYGPQHKPKILWMFVTENIIWSAPDKERAAGQNIRIVTERELRYYLQVAEHLGAAGRYQFLAEYLKNQPIPGLGKRVVPAIRGKLGGRRFYSFVTTPRTLLKIAFVNHRSLNDPDGLPSYQRLVNRTRMRQIGRFIQGGGFFPTNILINFSRQVQFDIVKHEPDADVTYGQLHLPDRYQSAWVIDGQHRLYGFANLPAQYLDSNLFVVAFEELPRQDEANLFVTINHEQRSVPKTLLDDLQGELKWGSTVPGERVGAIAARLIGLLNADVGEPFYGRVTQQGIPATSRTCLTVPALKDGLRKSGLIGRPILRDQQLDLGPFSGSTDLETLERARSGVNALFGMVRENNPTQWELGRDGVVCTNVAIQAFFMLFASLVSYMEANKGMDARELDAAEVVSEIEEYLEPVLKFLTATPEPSLRSFFTVQFGSGGPPEYYYRLCSLVKGSFSDFTPDGYQKWEAEQSDDKIRYADLKLKDMNIRVQAYIFDTFKLLYGRERDAYWHKGIADKTIKGNAYQKSLDDDDDVRLPLENYLDVVEYKRIVENKQHWPIFKAVFDIPLPGQKGLSKNLGWMERFNELRRISAHATRERSYRFEDFDFIDFVHDEFVRRSAATPPSMVGSGA